MQAGRTLRDMGMELDEDRVIADYAAGRPVDEIAAAYGLTQDEVEYLVVSNTKPLSGWSLQRTGNQITLAVLIGVVVGYFASLLGADGIAQLFVWAVAGFASFMVVRNYAGRDSSR